MSPAVIATVSVPPACTRSTEKNVARAAAHTIKTVERSDAKDGITGVLPERGIAAKPARTVPTAVWLSSGARTSDSRTSRASAIVVRTNDCFRRIVLKKSLFGDARFIGALRSGIQKIGWGTSRFSASAAYGFQFGEFLRQARFSSFSIQSGTSGGRR